jgi:hypothetical protein
VSHADLHSSILWRNRQTEAHLILRHKPRNHRGDFDIQIKKTVAVGFEPQTRKLEATGFEAKPGEIVVTDFKVKPKETVTVILRPSH